MGIKINKDNHLNIDHKFKIVNNDIIPIKIGSLLLHIKHLESSHLKL